MHTFIHQVFLSNTNNFHIVKLFQVFLSNTKNFMCYLLSVCTQLSGYKYLITMIMSKQLELKVAVLYTKNLEV